MTNGNGKIDWSNLWKNEDCWAIWFGFIIFIAALTGVVNKVPKIGKWSDDPLAAFTVIKEGVVTGNILLPLLVLMVALAVLFIMKVMPQ